MDKISTTEVLRKMKIRVNKSNAEETQIQHFGLLIPNLQIFVTNNVIRKFFQSLPVNSVSVATNPGYVADTEP